MKFSTLSALGASSLFTSALAGQITYNMTHNGVEVPVVLKSLPWMDRQLHLNKTAPQSKRDGPISVTTNWAGAIQNSPVAGSFHTIIADWNVPGIYPPPGVSAPTGSETYYLVEWVGIGSDCGTIIQAGTGQILTESGLEQIAWWEWFPDNSIQSINMPTGYMDKFRVKITATDPTNGYATGATYIIENETQGFTFTLTASGFSEACLDNAEWIVENVENTSMAWPTFENVYFSECAAYTTTGAEQGITGTTAVHGSSIDGRTVLSEYEDDSDFYVVP
ncbi:concanavalin A-like lectin/glucanase [Hyaloscypha variabilis]